MKSGTSSYVTYIVACSARWMKSVGCRRCRRCPRHIRRNRRATNRKGIVRVCVMSRHWRHVAASCNNLSIDTVITMEPSFFSRSLFFFFPPLSLSPSTPHLIYIHTRIYVCFQSLFHFVLFKEEASRLYTTACTLQAVVLQTLLLLESSIATQ